MRPEHIARHSTELLHRAFTMGAYLWCYDLYMDNTFQRDPEQYARLQKLVALRRSWLEHYGQGQFTDTVGLDSIPEEVLAKRYLIDRGLLIACASEKGLDGSILVQWDAPAPPECEIMTSQSPEPAQFLCELHVINGISWASVRLPEDELAVVVLRVPA